ncbi:YciI family protein [Streptosporangium carneum]|uniref:YCII-related domain-containing protein n=1 Tax=Streptosporangium carneum TaxID=47481 RepID=A0A9W6MBY8_9ACTN|nr:YciI family protein [Streptosporangium carneum]GLK08290.1 hypothetical protein GCM10017600_16950 [Streptosporangium carneum]
MKHLLLIYMNPTVWDALSDGERNEVMQGHDDFYKTVTESGELVSREAITYPAETATVRVRDGVREVTDGPHLEGKEFLAAYYLVDCESKERAIELAALIPDARINAVEVRPLIDLD